MNVKVIKPGPHSHLLVRHQNVDTCQDMLPERCISCEPIFQSEVCLLCSGFFLIDLFPLIEPWGGGGS